MVFPTSIAIIPDGNRRYAQKHGLSLARAYEKGFERSTQLLEWIKSTRIQSTTLWALSLENFMKRSHLELKVLFALMQKQLDEALEEVSDVPKIRFIGKTELLPASITQRMRKLEEKTSSNDRLLNIAIAYSGREEIAQAANAAAVAKENSEITEINEETLTRFLYQPQPVDLLIRTGNVQRISGFMPWQNAYAEVYFSKKLWPEFTQRDFRNALEFYARTERRFGK